MHLGPNRRSGFFVKYELTSECKLDSHTEPLLEKTVTQQTNNTEKLDKPESISRSNLHSTFSHELGVPRILVGQTGQETTDHRIPPLPRMMKRTMDLAIVIVVGLPLCPLLLLIAIAVKCCNSGPVFYSQQRIGHGGRPFRIWKFRSMLANAESVLQDYLRDHPELRKEWEIHRKLRNDPRVIPCLGKFLRKTSLDELPQLWNVLRGEMSVVGPRPLPQYHLDEFDENFCQFRHQLTPGITGLWQVSSRRSATRDMIVRYDSYYIENWSLLLDVRIILRTTAVVVSGSGAT